MTPTLESRAAFVAGGSRGIGAAIVRGLCAAGADVVLSSSGRTALGNEIARECEATWGRRCVAIAADQGDVAAASRAPRQAAEVLGRLDVVVVNAGVSVWAPLDQAVDPVAMDRQVRVNLLGATATIRAAAELLGDGGRIVAIGSAAADRIGMRGLADYAATKAALAGYVRGAARDLGPRGITVNLVQPGHVETELNPSTRESREAVRTQTALGRFGRPEEIAPMVVFLAGPDAAYITGATLDVDGGAGA